MDRLLCRTLARKSVFPPGCRHEYRSVQQVIDLHGIMYIAHSYYYYSMLSFLPDILEEIGIIDDLLITKPGINKEMFNEFKKRYYQALSSQTMKPTQEDLKIEHLKNK